MLLTYQNRFLFLFIGLLIGFGLACNASSQLTTSSATRQATVSDEAVQLAVATLEAKLSESAAAQSPMSLTSGSASDLEQSLISLYKQVNPSVVHIITDLGSGSGFVFNEDGYIVTNNHVVEGVTVLEVIFANGERRRGEIAGTEVDSDLAVIKVPDLPASIAPIQLGDSNKLQVGQLVLTIGNPFGEAGSMSMGIISGLGRSLSSQRLGYSLPQVIQTDAPINPGNSGGPLLDLHGQLIGVNTAIRTTTGVSSGVGFAVPVNAVKRIVPTLITTGSYTYPYLGIESPREPITLEMQEQLNLPQNTGAYISAVRPGGPADLAGLHGAETGGGDLIIAIDDNPIIEFNDLLSYLVFETEVGQQVELTIIRDGQQLTIPVTLGMRPQN